MYFPKDFVLPEGCSWVLFGVVRGWAEGEDGLSIFDGNLRYGCVASSFHKTVYDTGNIKRVFRSYECACVAQNLYVFETLYCNGYIHKGFLRFLCERIVCFLRAYWYWEEAGGCVSFQ